MEPLVAFNAAYYKYPASVHRGTWSRYPLDRDLTSDQREGRAEWLREAQRLSSTPFHRHVLSRYDEAGDETLFVDALLAHGVFVEAFFGPPVRHRIFPAIVADPEEPKKLTTLVDSATHSSYTEEARATLNGELAWEVANRLFEARLVQAVADKDAHGILDRWYDEHSSPRQCVVCGSTYRIIDLPDWVYGGANGTQVCCMQCQIVDQPSKDDLLPYVREFVEACGFVPPASANPLNSFFTSRLSPEQWCPVFLAYGKMGGMQHVKTEWSSWFLAMAASGVLPEGVIATARGIRCLAGDGHECHSLDEQRIDDWLVAHSLPHEREPHYPQHPSLNPRGGRRADWLVRDVYVEYFGLAGDVVYDKKTDEKIMLAAQLGITMLPVYPPDITSLDEALRCLLK